MLKKLAGRAGINQFSFANDDLLNVLFRLKALRTDVLKPIIELNYYKQIVRSVLLFIIDCAGDVEIPVLIHREALN